MTTASMTSPTGNATNPVDVSLGNEPSLDLTRATLTTSSDASTITATLPAPHWARPRPQTPRAGTPTTCLAVRRQGLLPARQRAERRHVQLHVGEHRHLRAVEHLRLQRRHQQRGHGQLQRGHHTVSISVPAKEVGSPDLGAALTVPQAFDQLNGSALTLTTDSSDDLTPIARDGGLADSIGEEVILGGAASPGSSASGSGFFGGSGSGSFGSGGGSAASRAAASAGSTVPPCTPLPAPPARASAPTAWPPTAAARAGSSRLAWPSPARSASAAGSSPPSTSGPRSPAASHVTSKGAGDEEVDLHPQAAPTQGRVPAVGPRHQLAPQDDQEHGPQAHLPAPALSAHG